MLLNADLNRGLSTNHGLHLNGFGIDVISKQLVSHIYTWLLEEATIPTDLVWKSEPSNMVSDEGSPVAVTESSMEVKGLIHLSQDPEQVSVKTVPNRMSSIQRIPVTRNEDFFYGETDFCFS
jgi:hypothetical protein